MAGGPYCGWVPPEQVEAAVAAERERCEAERWRVDNSGIEISYEELCTLSREFNKQANLSNLSNLSDPHHYRINEWLKKQIAAIREGE